MGWEERVRLVAMETEGANCLAAALERGQLVTLPAITSVAKTLGSLTVAQEAYTQATESRGPEVTSLVVSDRQALDACVDFADDHKMLVEPSCGAALAALYDSRVFQKIATGKKDLTVVMVVCGGIGISASDIETWRLAR